MDASDRDNPSSGNGPARDSNDEAWSSRSGPETADTAKQTAKSVIGDAKRATAAAAAQASSAIGDAAVSLEESGQSNLCQATSALADKLQGLSGYLENRSIDDLFEDARRLAARNPGLFIAGGVVIGVALSRFFKASLSTDPRSRDDDAAEDRDSDDMAEDVEHPGDGGGRASH